VTRNLDLCLFPVHCGALIGCGVSVVLSAVDYYLYLHKHKLAFVPPKPKLFVKAVFTVMCCGTFGT